MTSKDQLQSRIRELEEELKTFKEQLNNYKEITIETASVGDVLEDGSIVFKKENGLALLVAPKSTEVVCQWSEQFPEVFDKLKEQGFNPSQWFVPTEEQLRLTHNLNSILLNSILFDAYPYWSSTEFNTTRACVVNYRTDNVGYFLKASSYRVRAFRCVTYYT
jgi:hypothetical protein